MTAYLTPLEDINRMILGQELAQLGILPSHASCLHPLGGSTSGLCPPGGSISSLCPQGVVWEPHPGLLCCEITQLLIVAQVSPYWCYDGCDHFSTRLWGNAFLPHGYPGLLWHPHSMMLRWGICPPGLTHSSEPCLLVW